MDGSSAAADSACSASIDDTVVWSPPFENGTLRPSGASLAASRLASTNQIMFTTTSTAKAA
jgi:hypothetical protein